MSEMDECNGCEGWAEVDDDGNCSGCAYELVNAPWHVVALSLSRPVVEPGPFTSETAERIARLHNDSLRDADYGTFWRAERV